MINLLGLALRTFKFRNHYNEGDALSGRSRSRIEPLLLD
jgi:hypothetical protein